jgi:hypothetical protein
MIFYVRKPQEILGVVNRCYLEAKNGKVALCLTRLQELDCEFPDNPAVAYAEGQIRRDYLGEATDARRLFEKAYLLSVSYRHETETAWFAICNLVQLSRDPAEYQKWAAVAFLEKGKDQPECQHYHETLESLEVGELLSNYLIGASQAGLKMGQHGLAAALAEIALAGQPELSQLEYSELRKHRSHCLRQLDAAAEHFYEARGERFPPEERLALHYALEELDQAIALDQYDAKLWNYRSAWCNLLEQYEDCIEAANNAIKLRPHRYPRPYINKAQALWALQRDADALDCAEEGFRQTDGSGLPPETEVLTHILISRYKAGRTRPTLDQLAPIVDQLIKSSQNQSDEEFAQLRNHNVTQESVTNRIIGHLLTVQDNPMKGYVPIMAEVLSCFTPESAACITANLSKRHQSISNYCIVGAMFIAVHANGVHQRDAARYLCLMTMLLSNPTTMKGYYRSIFLTISAAATNEMSKIEPIVQTEFMRINLLLSRLLAEQELITDSEKSTAKIEVLSHLEGQLPKAGIETVPGSGCLGDMSAAMFIFGAGVIIILMSFFYFFGT